MIYEMLISSIKDIIFSCMIRLVAVYIGLAILVNDASAYQCVFCLPGKYKNLFDNSACTSCNANTYLDYSGAVYESECQGCGLNMQSPSGSSAKAACLCNAGFFGPAGGPCTQCATGKFAANIGQTVCTSCPANTTSDVQSDAVTDCQCVAGYTGPDGGVCDQCALNTYKPARGSQACTTCVANTMTLATGNIVETACICTPGYTVVASGSVLTQSICNRFFALFPKPSFETVSLKNNVGVGSNPLPVYNAVGGPSGNGHTQFGAESYFIVSARSISPKTNGGLTIITVLRWSGQLDRGNIFTLNGPGYYIALYVDTADTTLTMSISDDFGAYGLVKTAASGFVSNQWLRIAVTYSTSSLQMQMSINDMTPITTYADPSSSMMGSDGTLANGDSSIIAGGAPAIGTTGFVGDMAGLFFIDETLSSSQIASIQGAMVSTQDVALLCSSSASSVCSGCSIGKYKVDPGPAACTNCAVDKYSTAVAATAEATCVDCPSNTVSALGSGYLTACTCNTGYTGADGNACAACIVGKWKNETGSTACTDCGRGTYSGYTAAKTALTCATCPADSYTQLAGNDALEDCQCNAGYTGPNGGYCAACVPGKYKMTPGTHECTSCLPDTYSTAVASTTGATCVPCPTSSQSPESSSAKAACICNMGYTGAGGLAGVYVPSASFQDLTSSCGVNSNEKCGCAGSDVGTHHATKTCDKAFNDITTDVSAFLAMASMCPAEPRSSTWNFNTDCSTVWGMSRTGDQPYITIDFQRTVDVTAVEIYSYWNVVRELRPINFDIFIGDSSTIATNTACATNQNFPNTYNVFISFACVGRGRYLTVRNGLFLGNYMQIAEMQVVGSIPAQNVPCVSCVAGTFKPTTGSAVCTNCLANQYSTAVAATSNTCEWCSANMQAPEASNEAVDCKCNKGYTGADGATCTGCLAGKYKTSVGSATCVNCPVNTYSTMVAKPDSVCTACYSSSSQSYAGSDEGTDCKCNAGYFGADGAFCSRCSQGTYKLAASYTPESSTCTNCAANTYQPLNGATLASACLPCADNSQSPAASAESTSCLCNAGYSGPSGGTCTACYMGKYKSMPGPQQCTNCANATYSSATAATTYTTCLDCPLNSSSFMGSTARADCKCFFGFSTLKLGQPDSSCKQCPTGTFNDILDAEACSKCTAGKYSSAFGAKGIETCLTCPSSTFSLEGQPQCDLCPGNSTSPANSGVITACQCNPGFFGANGQACQTCQVGTWKSLWGPSECINCPKDTYSSEVARTSIAQCQNCLANSESVEGSYTRTACKCSFGYTSSVIGLDGEACIACSAGLYKNYTGHAACTKCPKDTYNDVEGSKSISSCIYCFANSISSEGSSSVEQCRCVGGFERAA